MAESPQLPDAKFLSKVKEPTAGYWLFTALKRQATMDRFEAAFRYVENHPDCNIIVPQGDNVAMFVYECSKDKDVLQPDKDDRFRGMWVLRGKCKVPNQT